MSLLSPAPVDTGRGLTLFQWAPKGSVGPNDCYELRFWQGGADNWANGFGLMPHTANTSISINLGEDLERALGPGRLVPGQDYFWGVLHVPCNPYQRPERLLSEVRRFTYNNPPSPDP